MFYYLLYNSSFSFIVENRLFSTILYGSILYILAHAVLNYCDVSILTIINNYFWILLTLDIISFSYSLYKTFIDIETYSNTNNNSNNEKNSLNVSFNLLKNKINTILDRKNDLTITQTPSQQTITNPNNTRQSNENINLQNKNNLIKNNGKANNTNKFSTPISQLHNLKQNSNTYTNINVNSNSNLQNNKSTPINLIRNNQNNIEPYIDDNDDNLELQDLQDLHNLQNSDNQYSESVAGSDVGSIMDLADFENTL